MSRHLYEHRHEQPVAPPAVLASLCQNVLSPVSYRFHRLTSCSHLPAHGPERTQKPLSRSHRRSKDIGTQTSEQWSQFAINCFTQDCTSGAQQHPYVSLQRVLTNVSSSLRRGAPPLLVAAVFHSVVTPMLQVNLLHYQEATQKSSALLHLYIMYPWAKR